MCARLSFLIPSPTLPFKRSTKNVSRELDNGEQIYACMYIDIYLTYSVHSNSIKNIWSHKQGSNFRVLFFNVYCVWAPVPSCTHARTRGCPHAHTCTRSTFLYLSGDSGKKQWKESGVCLLPAVLKPWGEENREGNRCRWNRGKSEG